MERAVGGGADAVAEMITLGTDLMFRYLVDRDDLSASAALVLNRINREGPMRLTALAEAEGASQSGMTQLVQRMERQGLLERWSDPDDGRASLVMLGEAGQRFWAARNDVLRAASRRVVGRGVRRRSGGVMVAAQVVVRVLGEMREIAGLNARVGADNGGHP